MIYRGWPSRETLNSQVRRPIKKALRLLIVTLVVAGCAPSFGPEKIAKQEVVLYSDVNQASEMTVPEGTACRISQRMSHGKVYGFHWTECENGFKGYLMVGDEKIFD
jgi:hypothetical protein